MNKQLIPQKKVQIANENIMWAKHIKKKKALIRWAKI